MTPAIFLSSASALAVSTAVVVAQPAYADDYSEQINEDINFRLFINDENPENPTGNMAGDKGESEKDEYSIKAKLPTPGSNSGRVENHYSIVVENQGNEDALIWNRVALIDRDTGNLLKLSRIRSSSIPANKTVKEDFEFLAYSSEYGQKHNYRIALISENKKTIIAKKDFSFTLERSMQSDYSPFYFKDVNMELGTKVLARLKSGEANSSTPREVIERIEVIGDKPDWVYINEDNDGKSREIFLNPTKEESVGETTIPLKIIYTDGSSLEDEMKITVSEPSSNPGDGDGDGTDSEGNVDGEGTGEGDGNATDEPDLKDTDGDGIPDKFDPDADNDGINNADELEIGTNPLIEDTDGNGTPDGEEDFDNDGIKNSDESTVPDGRVVNEDDSPFGNVSITDKDGNGIADIRENTIVSDSTETPKNVTEENETNKDGEVTDGTTTTNVIEEKGREGKVVSETKTNSNTTKRTESSPVEEKDSTIHNKREIIIDRSGDDKAIDSGMVGGNNNLRETGSYPEQSGKKIGPKVDTGGKVERNNNIIHKIINFFN